MIIIKFWKSVNYKGKVTFAKVAWGPNGHLQPALQTHNFVFQIWFIRIISHDFIIGLKTAEHTFKEVPL